MIDCGKIGCGISGSDAAVILPEGNIEHPVQAIFHLPVIADVLCHFLRRSKEARKDEIYNCLTVSALPVI